jgi:DNA invertase Pin-like site-specific DNA recombinase
LFIATLDRLARKVAFIANLMDSKLDIVVGDMPYASRFTLHIMAAVAEEEGRRISERTKKGLEMAKLRGVMLGSNNPKWKKSRVGCPGIEKARAVSGQKRTAETRDFYQVLMPSIKEKQEAGCTLQQIADDLNGVGHLTRGLMPYTEATISRLLKRYR